MEMKCTDIVDGAETINLTLSEDWYFKYIFVPMAIAVFPVPGWPAIKTARPAIFASLKKNTITGYVKLSESWCINNKSIPKIIEKQVCWNHKTIT